MREKIEVEIEGERVGIKPSWKDRVWMRKHCAEMNVTRRSKSAHV